MATKVVMRESDVTLAQIQDLLRQFADGSLRRRHVQAFLDHRNPFEIPMEPMEQWTMFYGNFFGMDVDLAKIKVPKNPSDFDQILFIPKGLDYDMAEKACKRAFKKFCKWDNTPLAELIDMKEEARTTNAAYAIRVRDCIEADKVHKNKSADMLAEEGVASVTLLERLVHGLFFYWISGGKHLDYRFATLCSGSRYRDGNVPDVYFHPDDESVTVYWDFPDNRSDSLRVREQVS